MSSAAHCEFEVLIDEPMVMKFAELSGDFNPLHVDTLFAAETQFGKPIAHGMLLMAFASRVLGMYIPGRECIIISSKSEFPNPVLYPQKVVVEGDLLHAASSGDAGIVAVTVRNAVTGKVHLNSKITYTLSHGGYSQTEPTQVIPRTQRSETKKQRLLVTGGTGGLGRTVCDMLAKQYDLTVLSRNPDSYDESEAIEYLKVDLDAETDLTDLLSRLPSHAYYGIVHMSAPTPNDSFVTADLKGLRGQLRHGIEVPVELAKWSRQADSEVRRIVLVGSIAGGSHPLVRQGSYSVAKNSLAFLPQVLAAELAISHITVNAISLGWTGTGMNSGMSRREQARREAQSAIGRFVSAQDLFHLIEYLLDSRASATNGTVISLDGGLIRA